MDGRSGAAAALPPLRPVLVAAERDIDGVLRSTRADIARLSLELRVALHEAELAEQAAGFGAGSHSDELRAADDMLRAAIEPRVAARRSELASEVERARSDAAHQLRAAREEAAAVVGAARQDLVDALVGPTAPDRSAPFPRPEAPPAPSSSRPPVPDATWSVFARPRIEHVAPNGQHAFAAPPDVVEAPPPAPPLVKAPRAAKARPRRAPRARKVPAGGPPSLRARFAHADVLMPLVAVLIVLILLVAWLA